MDEHEKRFWEGESEKHICSICQSEYIGFGNNAQPINDGRCCNGCNGIVIQARLNQMTRIRRRLVSRRKPDESYTH